MAIFEESPNFENLLDSVNVVDKSLFIESLGSVANQVKLGDTNTAVCWGGWRLTRRRGPLSTSKKL